MAETPAPVGNIPFVSSGERSTPEIPTVIPYFISDEKAKASTVGINGPSMVFDKNTGTARLTPLLSYRYFSVLSTKSWWTESLPGSASAASTSQAKKTNRGNSFEIISRTYNPNADSNSPGGGSGSKYMLKVFGYGEARTLADTFVDSQSAVAAHHYNNILLASDTDNAWREEAITELALAIQQYDSSSGSVLPLRLIRPNMAYFICGQDPTSADMVSARFSSGTVGILSYLTAERILTTQEALPKNSSFAIQWHFYADFLKLFIPKSISSTVKSQHASGYFRVYFGGKYCFQFNNPDAYFIPDTTQPKDKWIFMPIDTLKLSDPGNTKTLITLIFEVVGNSILISNAGEPQKHDPLSTRSSWSYTPLEDVTFDAPNPGTHSNELTIESKQLVFGVCGLDIAFTYIPVVYPKRGRLSVRNTGVEDTGYSLAGIKVHEIKDSAASMGGEVKAEIIKDSGKFGYDIDVYRGEVDKSPAVYSVEIQSPVALSTVGYSVDLNGAGIRKLDLTLGVNSQSGSVTISNRNGYLSRLGGIFPVTISCGWNDGSGQTSVEPIFKGFAENQNTEKNQSSTITLSLIGKDRVLVDALAFNLPIYDGYDDATAIDDLLQRAGWNGESNLEGGYQLSIPAYGVPPRWMFPLGKSIMSCIQDIALAAGKWAFVDHLGVFNYIHQKAGYGGNLPTVYQEIPTKGEFDEWLVLGGSRESGDARNAVMVVGLTGQGLDNPIPVWAVKKDEGGTIGDMQSSCYIPWYRWIVYQDAKITDASEAQKIAEQLFQNNNRLRINIQGRVWGDPKIVPWKQFYTNLALDDVGIPDGSQAKFRVLSAQHTLNAEEGTWFTSIMAEYVDPTVTYANWWDYDGGYGGY